MAWFVGFPFIEKMCPQAIIWSQYWLIIKLINSDKILLVYVNMIIRSFLCFQYGIVFVIIFSSQTRVCLGQVKFLLVRLSEKMVCLVSEKMAEKVRNHNFDSWIFLIIQIPGRPPALLLNTYWGLVILNLCTIWRILQATSGTVTIFCSIGIGLGLGCYISSINLLIF